MNFNNVLKNKYLYYAAVALMVINVLGYVSLGSIECVLVLGGAAYLANHFTKNRTVDIFIGLFVSNILFGCGRLREGFEGVDGTLHKKAADEMTKAKAAAAAGDQDTAQVKAGAAQAIAEVAKKCKEGEKMVDGKCQAAA